MFPNEHPSYISRRLEARMSKLKKLQDQITQIDPADPDAMKQALIDVVGEMRELTLATGILNGRVLRDR